MKIKTIYFWRIQGANGRWKQTRHRADEEDIRAQNPDARGIERVEGGGISFEVGETPEEVDELDRRRVHKTPANSRGDGS